MLAARLRLLKNGGGILLLAALSLSACKTREVGGGPSDDGELVFSDDFERTELGESWERGTGEGGGGKWVIRDGRVHGQNIKNDPLWYVQPLPRKVRVEFDAKSLSKEGDLKVEIFGDGENHASGYILIYGGWKNTLDTIARLDEHGDDRKTRASRKVEPNKVYRFAIERRDNTIKWFVDGTQFMEYPDSEPLQGQKHAYFAFNDWTAPVSFDNFKVYRLP